MRELDVETVEILRVDRDEAALLELERTHDVIRIDVLAGVLAHLVVADRREVARSTKWKRSSFELVAVSIRTGMLTSPNEIVPLQIGRGAMEPSSPPRGPKTAPKRLIFRCSSCMPSRLHNEYMAGISLWTLWTGPSSRPVANPAETCVLKML